MQVLGSLPRRDYRPCGSLSSVPLGIGKRKQQGVMPPRIPEPLEMLENAGIHASEQIGVAARPEAFNPGTLLVWGDAFAPRDELRGRRDPDDLMPQHVRRVPVGVRQRALVGAKAEDRVSLF